MKRVAVAAVALLAAACGTTVPVSQQSQALSGVDGLSSAGTASSAEAAPDAAGSGSVGSLPSGSTTGGPGAVGPTGRPSPTNPVPTSGGGAVVKGVSPVNVGLLYLTGADQLASSIGISGLATGDTRAQAKAVFDYVNAHGGLAGHRIVPSYYAIKASDSANDPARAQQAGCTSLTQDAHVQFVVSIVNVKPSTLACFAKAGVTVLDDVAGIATLEPRLQRYLYAPGDFATARLMKVLVDGLWRTGWLNAKSVVGSYTYDTRENNAVVEQALLPALKAHGLDIKERAAVSDGADAVNQASAAALKFRASGVDRVIPVIASPLIMMLAANSQNYTPEYAIYSTFGPGALMEGTAPPAQLKGAAGIGWQPYLDIGAGTHPGPVSGNETLCFALMKAANQTATQSTTKGLQTNVCNVILYLQYAANKVGSVSGDLLSRASSLVRASFPPADTFRTDMTSRYDGADGYHDLVYQDACSCFQYVGAVRAAG